MMRLLNGKVKSVVVAGLTAVALAGAAAGVDAQSNGFRRVDIVEAGEVDTWRVWVPAGEVRVVVDGDGDTDLDLEVIDARTGEVLAIDDDYTDYCITRFRTYRSGYVQVRISNLGNVWNRYELRVTY